MLEYYKDDAEIYSVDAFSCGFPAGFCEVFTPLIRTLILYPYHRYALARCNAASWRRLDALLATANNDTPPGPRRMFIAPNEYEAEYLAYFLGTTPPIFRLSTSRYSGLMLVTSRMHKHRRTWCLSRAGSMRFRTRGFEASPTRRDDGRQTNASPLCETRTRGTKVCRFSQTTAPP